MKVKRVDRKLLIATFSEYAPIRELANLLQQVKCEDCIHFAAIKGNIRGVMDADPDECYCELGLDDTLGSCEHGEER